MLQVPLIEKSWAWTFISLWETSPEVVQITCVVKSGRNQLSCVRMQGSAKQSEVKLITFLQSWRKYSELLLEQRSNTVIYNNYLQLLCGNLGGHDAVYHIFISKMYICVYHRSDYLISLNIYFAPSIVMIGMEIQLNRDNLIESHNKIYNVDCVDMMTHSGGFRRVVVSDFFSYWILETY